MAFGDIYRASVLFSAPGADNPMVITFHYQNNLSPVVLTPAQECGEIASLLQLELVANYLPFVTQDVEMISVNVIGISEPTAFFDLATTDPGTVVDEVSSWRTSPIAAWKSGLRGRSYNGRSHLISPPESQITNGTMDAAYLVNLDAAMNAIATLELPGTNQYIIGTYSRVLAVFSPSINVVIRSKPGSLRSRQKTL